MHCKRTLLPIIYTTCQRILHSRRFQSPPNSNNSQNPQCPPLTTIQIRHSTQILNFRHSMNNSSISPQSINSTQDNSSQSKSQRDCILCKNSTQRLELSNKVRSQRQGHITQTKDEKPNTKQRHSSCSTTKIFQSFCMCAVIHSSYTQKECRTPNTVCLHCINGPENSNFIHCK